jgi:hypothetical protein
MIVAVVSAGYVINVVNVEKEVFDAGWKPMGEHDALIIDEREVVAIGDWYEQEEGRFYRPL